MRRTTRRAISALVALIMVFSPALGVIRHVYAASFPMQLFVQGFQSGNLTLYWSGLPETESVKVTYHHPDDAGNPVEEILIFNQQESSVTIPNLQNDIIYDIEIRMYNAPDCGGAEIGHGLIFFMPRITFLATRLEQQRVPLEGGGFETGVQPGLNLKWAMPKVFNGTDFVYLDQALDYMETQINQVYGDQRELDSLGFRINISTDATKLNGGSAEAGLVISSGTPEYTVHVSGNPGIEAKVHGPDANGFMNFDLIGRKDKDSEPPLPKDEYQLRDWDILPGTVYYMNIKPVFTDSEGNPQNAVTVGPQQAQNGSLLSGPFNYTYTPIRFQLTRDGLNNIYVKIYKINDGSLDLPRMYYQVQSSDDPSIPGDWPVRKTLDDTYFGGDSTVTVISGVSPGNLIYYKVVVKTDAQADRLESPAMPYRISEDLIKSPVPTGVAVTGRTLRDGQVVHPISGETVQVRTTDIVLSWEKPEGWESIKDNLYFHVLLSTAQSQTDEDVPLYLNGELWENYPVRYRLVKYISGSSPNITDNGSSLSYTINGFDLFTWEDENGNSYEIPNDEGYPDFLLPNTVYYLQMYTTDKQHKGSQDPEFMSDRSLTISFTTLRHEERDVPLPAGFSIYSNSIDDNGINRIQVQFNGLREHQLEWHYYTSQPHAGDRIYYDLYMSTRTQLDSFILIGSTEQAGDVVFHSATMDTGIYVTADISRFSPGTPAYSAFGESLKPNVTYYFMMKTRLSMVNEPEDKESVPTVLLPVTTVKGEVLPPDESARKPVAPADFAIARDDDGNPAVSGTSVSLAWLLRERDALYQVICTRERVDKDATLQDFEGDPLYISFINKYGDMDSDGDSGTFTLDPDVDLENGFFEYNGETGLLILHIKNWLYPNRLYYFSIRAVNENGTSAWVSIPVTTLPVEMPALLEPVTDVQAGFKWNDPDPAASLEDFSIYIKESGESNYRMLSKSGYTIARDGTTYYARITNLKADTVYDIRVYKGENMSRPFYEINGYKTLDNRHQVHVKWKGREAYSYQIELKKEDSSSYVLLDESDYELYREETYQTAGTEYCIYHAIIKTAALSSTPGGSLEKTPLHSNTAYHVRVRTRMTDPLDPSIVSYSKFTAAIRIRTEFDQQDYDEAEEENRKKTAFLDRITAIEEDIYWRVDILNGTTCIVLLKPERVSNLMKELMGTPFVLNLEAIAPEMNRYSVYVPADVVETANMLSASFVIEAAGIRCLLRPGWVSSGMEEMTGIYAINGVKGVYYRIDIERAGKEEFNHEGNALPLSDVWKLSVNAEGMAITSAAVEELIHNRLYDEETGIVNEKLNEFLEMYRGNLSSPGFYNYIAGMANLIKNEISMYVKKVLETNKVRKALAQINRFDAPAVLEIEYERTEGTIAPFVKPAGTISWSKVTDSYNAYSGGVLSFNADGAGWYAAVLQRQLSGNDRLHPAAEHIEKLMGMYDLAEIFDGFEYTARPDRFVTAREAVLLFEKVSGWTGAGTVPDIGARARKMGLDRYIDTGRLNRNISRQEIAGILFLLYSVKTGMNTEYWKPSSVIWILDESNIDDNLWRPVMFSIECGILGTSNGGYFYPRKEISRGDLCAAVLRLLQLAGK